MIKRADGTVAVKWVINPNGKTVRIGDTNVYYVFKPQNHVVMAWVQESDVPGLLAVREKTCNCAGGIKKQAFELANIIDVNVFTFNNRNGGMESDYREIE